MMLRWEPDAEYPDPAPGEPKRVSYPRTRAEAQQAYAKFASMQDLSNVGLLSTLILLPMGGGAIALYLLRALLTALHWFGF